MFKYSCLLFVVLFQFANAQLSLDKKCPTDRPVVKDFDLTKYLGTWFELLRYEQAYEKDCNCVTLNYSERKTGGLTVKNCCSRSKDDESYCAEGSAVLSAPEEKPWMGKMNVTFDEEQPDTPNYWVLATDYTNYAVVYYCKDLEENKSSDSAWVISRTKKWDDKVKKEVDGIIDKYFIKDKMAEATHDADSCMSL